MAAPRSPTRYTPEITRSKGRGTTANPVNRFQRESTELTDDGWEADPRAETIATELRIDTAKSLITRNQSPDIAFEQSINPYKGCEHGCIYCFARPSHAYLDLSPGLDFESILYYKPDAPALLEKELTRNSYRCQPTMLGANTDPYQPIDRKLALTRRILAVLNQYRHPIHIITKGALIERDIDILAEMARWNGVQIMVSITTLDSDLARTLEPRAATATRRLSAIKKLREAGIPTGVLIAPVIPALTDHEIEAILEAAAGAGATLARYILLRLPLEVAPLFDHWLHTHYPLKQQHVMNQVREMRGGKLYNAEWFKRFQGEGARAELIRQRFHIARKKYGLDHYTQLDYSRFGTQTSLF